MAYSPTEVLRSKDFEEMSTAEVLQARKVIRSLRLDLRPVLTRRHEPDPRGRFIDMRRTLRTSIRTGGCPLPLERKSTRTRPPTIVALCDISGSMESYSRTLLHFFHTLTNAGDRAHTFVFGTRLTNITRLLRDRDVDRALDRIGNTVRDWYGGTRIGASLEAFNLHWSRRLLAQGAVVLLVTDGLDREGGEGIRAQARRLRKSCRSLVWLNPLLRYRDFAPKAAGIRALLPEVERAPAGPQPGQSGGVGRVVERAGRGAGDRVVHIADIYATKSWSAVRAKAYAPVTAACGGKHWRPTPSSAYDAPRQPPIATTPRRERTGFRSGRRQGGPRWQHPREG